MVHLSLRRAAEGRAAEMTKGRPLSRDRTDVLRQSAGRPTLRQARQDLTLSYLRENVMHDVLMFPANQHYAGELCDVRHQASLLSFCPLCDRLQMEPGTQW